MDKVTDTSHTRIKDGPSGLSSDSSDDEPLVKIASKRPQVTMLLKVMVERCQVKEFGNRCKGTELRLRLDPSVLEEEAEIQRRKPDGKKGFCKTEERDESVLDSADDEDDVPLMSVLKNLKDEKQSEQTDGQTLNSEGQTHDQGDSSDDEPLFRVARSRAAKKASANQIQSRSINMGKRPAVLNSSDDEDEDDEDDVPLGNLLKKLKEEKTSEETAGQSLSSEAPQTQDEGDSSDDEPLSRVAKSRAAKKASANQNQSKKIHTCKTVLISSDDEDDVPLMNLLKKTTEEEQSEQTAGQTLNSEAPQTQHDDDSSDDEPLSKFTNTRPSKKEEANPIELKSSRRTNQKKKRTGSTSDDSDDEPSKMTSPRPSTKSRKPQPEPQRRRQKDTESSDGSSDDDVLLVNLNRKENQSTTETKTRSTPAQRSTSKPPTRAPRMHATAAESSDDEPLLNLLKKPLKDGTNKSLSQGNGQRTEKRDQTPSNNNQGPTGKAIVTKKMKRQRACNNGLSSDSSDDEPLVKIASKRPQVTMLLKVMVERCQV